MIEWNGKGSGLLTYGTGSSLERVGAQVDKFDGATLIAVWPWIPAACAGEAILLGGECLNSVCCPFSSSN